MFHKICSVEIRKIISINGIQLNDECILRDSLSIPNNKKYFVTLVTYVYKKYR